MRPLFCALITWATVSIAPAGAQEAYPFLGRWGGGPTDCSDPFVFDRGSYKPPGERAMRWRGVRRDGRAYVLSFPDGYEVTVMPLPNGRLSWLSGASGDAFELRRCS